MTELFLEGNVENAAFSRQFEPSCSNKLRNHFWLRPPLRAVQDTSDFDNAFADAINGEEG